MRRMYKTIIAMIMILGLIAGILSGCGKSKAEADVPEQTEEEAPSQTAEQPEEEAVETENDAEEAEPAGSEEDYDAVCTLYLGGAEDASVGMEMVDDQFNDDGTYRNEYVSDDGMLSICEAGNFLSGDEFEDLEKAAIEMARRILPEGKESADETAELNEEYSANTSYPVYIVTFTTGSNEDTWSWKAFTLSTDTCGLVYAIGAPADFDEDMLALADETFPKLRVVDKDEGLETNDVSYMTDLFDYYGANIEHVATDIPELEYDDSYKSAEGTTEISAPTDTMEKMSDGIALAGPFFTVDKDGTVVGVNYGGQTYSVCGITAGMPMSEAAEIAKSHGFTFSDVEIAHGTAKYVVIYDNGEMRLCITSDADGDFSKTGESDVTGNVDGILLTTK
ncbi:MAG: hypothetical protein K5985_07310 [Lachnospiraceae bacterium]|nr:hypothetical protein [Lachnospiraceae bacterium]